MLDRKRYKRCDFLFLKKSYKGSPGESYEQIFWLTQRSIEQHRPAFKLVSRQESSEFVVRIHSNEKYPWRFPGVVTERGAISAGDYALMDGERMLAVVERKTLDTPNTICRSPLTRWYTCYTIRNGGVTRSKV